MVFFALAGYKTHLETSPKRSFNHVLRLIPFAGFASVAGVNVTLTTKSIAFSAPRRHLFVNWDPAPSPNPLGSSGVAGAALTVEIQDAATGRPIPPFTLHNCMPIATASTRVQVRWRGVGGGELGALAGWYP